MFVAAVVLVAIHVEHPADQVAVQRGVCHFEIDYCVLKNMCDIDVVFNEYCYNK